MEKQNKKRIGVFFGGRSPEHDVSIITGQLIIAGLKGMNYDVMPIYLSKDGDWHFGKELDSVEFFTFADKENNLKKLGRFYLDLQVCRTSHVLQFKKRGFLAKKIEIDIAFPAFHGVNGEDGAIQGLFELLNVPYVGCGVASSAIAMDKVLTKSFYNANNIETAKSTSFTKKDWEEDKQKVLQNIEERIGFPSIIKPASLGSSIGISKAKMQKDLELGIGVALHYDQKVLVERCVENLMDLTCSVLGNEDPQPSLIQESTFADELFSYDEKYIKEGGTQTGKAKKNIIIPARLDEVTTKTIQDLSVKIFKLLGCSGIARVDFLYDKVNKKIYANEINTLPGTLYHHLWRKSDISLEELLFQLIELAEEKHKTKQDVTFTFESKILNQVNLSKLSN